MIPYIKVIYTPAVYLLVLGAWLSGCRSEAKKQHAQRIESYPVISLRTQPAALRSEYVCDLNAIQHVEIRARVAGYLDRILVDEGQQVRKGQVLFQINDAEYKNELAKASANLKNAIAEAKMTQMEIDRVQVLVGKKVISKTELELAKARLEVAQAKIEEARSMHTNASLRLSQTQIRAPFDGTLNRIPHKTGSLIEEGTLLTTLADNRAVYAYFNVSEKEYLEYVRKNKNNPSRDGEKVDLLLADHSLYPHRGEIETMEGVFDPSTGSIAFRARFPNPDYVLKHGSSGKIRLTTPVSDALLVPQKAVFEIQDKNYVFLVDNRNRVRMQNFIPKGRVSQFYLVHSGLQPGEQVVYEGIQNIREGMRIDPRPMQADSLFSLARYIPQ